MNNITIEEVKDILKRSIDETANMNEAIERTLQLIYLKGWNDAKNLQVKQTDWIPVSEESPKKTGRYWCTFGGTNSTGVDYYTTESDAKKFFDEPEEYTGWESQNVIAWMPLPESYKSRK